MSIKMMNFLLAVLNLYICNNFSLYNNDFMKNNLQIKITIIITIYNFQYIFIHGYYTLYCLKDQFLNNNMKYELI